MYIGDMFRERAVINVVRTCVPAPLRLTIKQCMFASLFELT